MALIVTVILSDLDEKILLNDLLDIDEWVQKAVLGKINSCKKRFVAQGIQTLQQDPEVSVMPANGDDIVSVITTRADYKDRATRDAEEELDTSR